MDIDATRSPSALTRRAALAGLGTAGVGVALATTARFAAAQEGAGDLASHPMVGTWAAMTPGGVVPQIHGADGSFIAAFPPNYVDPQSGLLFQGPGLGRWEPDGERRANFTFLQALSDASGAYVGTVQVAAAIEVSEDGQTWVGVGDGTRVIMRDAANNVTVDQLIPSGDLTVTGIRIGATAESLVLPVATPAAATPGTGTPTT
jgi:hypothetical protein